MRELGAERIGGPGRGEFKPGRNFDGQLPIDIKCVPLQARAFARFGANRVSQAGVVARFNAYHVDRDAPVARAISIMATVQEGTPQAEM